MLELIKIKKSYKTKDFVQNALNGVSISFRENEFASILGASGSGKTTMLNIIGGLDQYDAGDLKIDGTSTKEYKSKDWDIYRNERVGFVFQSYNLIPHQNVLSNVELALTISGVSRKERKERAKKALDEVGLIDHIYKLPTQLSGGQMQRVAIARALINDPEIVLADEPTGALDSETSVQVMALLEKIAEDRLVIMVTHNPELAHQYTNRIIELKDGEVIGDSNPYLSREIEDPNLKKKKPKNMSFFTAISLSISNLRTKKGRTFITSLAGSIGIIGIASILALASGINLYIENIEKETMSAYPLSIDSSGIDILSFLGAGESLMKKEELKDDEIHVIDSISTMFSHQNKNDLKALKDYMDANPDLIDPYVKTVQYKYSHTPLIYLQDEKEDVRQVNPDSIFTTFGIGQPAGLEMLAGGSEMGMKSFNELPNDEDLYLEQYEVQKGRWPKNKNEAIVVLTDFGSLTDFSLYSMGLLDRETLKEEFELFFEGEILDEERVYRKTNFDAILNKKFKVVQAADKYAYDDHLDIYYDRSNDKKFMDDLIDNGLDLEIVGIVRVKDEVKTPMLSSGIYYTHDLTTHLIIEAADKDIVKAQLANKDINIFTNKSFHDENQFNFQEEFDFSKFISIDQSMIQKAFKFNMPNFDFNMNLDFENLEFDGLKLDNLASLLSEFINLPINEIQEYLEIITQEFTDSLDETEDLAQIQEKLDLFFEEAREDILVILDNAGINANMAEEINSILENYIKDIFTTNLESVMVQISKQFESQIKAINPDQVVQIDPVYLMNAFKFNLDETDLFSLIKGLGDNTQNNANSNLSTLGFRDLETPSQINLYPRDFVSKTEVINFLDTYNENMQKLDKEDKVIRYTDFVGAMMSSVSTIIDTISYALIAFVAISLIVSSIMIGVITYVSVLERIKEIGILRAIGASKKDIRRVFNAETLIIGFFAGGFGIIITYLISQVANVIVLDKFNIPNIAYLKPQHALILTGISMVLAFVSGLIPASSAAKKDPVEALRTE